MSIPKMNVLALGSGGAESVAKPVRYKGFSVNKSDVTTRPHMVRFDYEDRLQSDETVVGAIAVPLVRDVLSVVHTWENFPSQQVVNIYIDTGDRTPETVLVDVFVFVAKK